MPEAMVDPLSRKDARLPATILAAEGDGPRRGVNIVNFRAPASGESAR